MSIKRSFGGSTLRKPGAYSQSLPSQNGSQNPASSGILFVVGEADTGKPGSVGGIASYSAAQLGQLVNDFTHGPIVDCARKAANPSQGQTGGFDTILVWKTNASTQASLQLQASSANVFQILAAKYGVSGNAISAALAAGTSSSLQRIITLFDSKNNITEVLPQNPAVAQLSIQYSGSGSACTMTIAGSSALNLTLSTTATGASSDSITSLALNGMSMAQLVAYLNGYNGGGKYTATLLNAQTGTVQPATDLDAVSAIDIKTSLVSMYRLQQELVDGINANSKLCVAIKNGWGNPGIPAVSSAAPLSGGARGASANSDFSTGLAKSLGFDYNVAMCAVSNDATVDITNGTTDAGSTYTIASCLAAIESNCRSRGQIKNRKECQWVGGMRASTKATVYTEAQTLNSELGQLCLQDVLCQDENSNLVWMPPHVLAAMLAGMRCGVDIGTPLTHKFLNCSGIGHYVNSATGIVGGDFDPQIDYDPALDAGVTFAEQNSGGFRIVCDNTTYGKDGSFVFNRGSVVQAAQYTAQTVRQISEAFYVGNKLSNGAASSMKNGIRKALIDLNKADIITASSDGAPQGFVEKTFTVDVQGNTATVNVEIKPVQGLDFVLINFTLGDISQSA